MLYLQPFSGPQAALPHAFCEASLRTSALASAPLFPALQNTTAILTHGNRCGHNPAAPRLALTRPAITGAGGLPRILTLAQERVEEFFHAPRKYQRFFVNACGSQAVQGERAASPFPLHPHPQATRGVASDYENNQLDAANNNAQPNLLSARAKQTSGRIGNLLQGQGGSAPLQVQGSAPVGCRGEVRPAGGVRLLRSERREALVLISKALFSRLDLVSLCCGHRSPTGFSDVSMRELVSLTGLSQRRCERAIALLKQGGFVEVSQPRERNNQGRYYGLRAIRVVTDFFFACLGLDRILKKEKAKAVKRLESLGWYKARFGNWKKFFKGKFGGTRRGDLSQINTSPLSPAYTARVPGNEPMTGAQTCNFRPQVNAALQLNGHGPESHHETGHKAARFAGALQNSHLGGAGGIISPARRRHLTPSAAGNNNHPNSSLPPDLLKRWNQAMNQVFARFPDISERAARHFANNALGLPLDFNPVK